MTEKDNIGELLLNSLVIIYQGQKARLSAEVTHSISTDFQEAPKYKMSWIVLLLCRRVPIRNIAAAGGTQKVKYCLELDGHELILTTQESGQR